MARPPAKAAVSLVALLLPLAAATPAALAADETCALQVRSLEARPAEKFVVFEPDTNILSETWTPGLSPGDIVTWANPLFEDEGGAKKVGHDQGYCFRMNGTVWDCAFTWFLQDGLLTAQGPVDDTADTVIPLTGGTGKRVGAKGQVTVHSQVGKFRYDFVLEGSAQPGDGERFKVLDQDHGIVNVLAGDILTWASPLSDGATQLSNQGHCLRMAANNWDCAFTWFLPEGQLTAQGPWDKTADSLIPVTGGTGKHIGAKGQVTIGTLADKFCYAFVLSRKPQGPGERFVVFEQDRKILKETGDIVTWASPLFKDEGSAKKMGHDQGHCLRMDSATKWDCRFTWFLPTGELTAQGPMDDTADTLVAITGGSGAYVGAKGQATLRTLSGQFHYSFELVDL